MTFFGQHRQTLRSCSLAAVVAGSLLVSATPAAAHGSHIVEPGDTLSEIAQDTGIPVAALIAENDLSGPDSIRIGQELSIPHLDGSDTTSAAPEPVAPSYVVAAGDTLSQIAERLGVSSAALSEVNGITDPNSIRDGQSLVVPAGANSVAVYTDLPARIQERAERQALIPIFEQWSAANDLPVDLVMAVAWQESGWNNDAVSFKGAVGVGQIMPATGTWVAADLIGRPDLSTANVEDNIRISARYLRWLIDYLGDEDLAIAGYYQGPGAVRAGIMYEDTVEYIANVQAQRQFFVAS